MIYFFLLNDSIDTVVFYAFMEFTSGLGVRAWLFSQMLGEDLKLHMNHSVLGFSHEMEVFHIDLIERSTTEAEIAIQSFQLLRKSDDSSPTYIPKWSNRSSTLSIKQLVMVSSCGLSSAGSVLVESSNCKVFALNRGLGTNIIPAAFLELEWKCSAFHSIKAVVSQVGALLLLNKYIIATPSG